MGRKAKPWRRRGRDGWWAKLGGRQIRLGDTEREAWVELSRLMGNPGAELATLTTGRLLDLWLDDRRRTVKPITYSIYARYAQSLVDEWGRTLARDLRERHIDAWLNAHPAWDGCRCLAATVAKMAFRWGKRKGYLEVNHLAEMAGAGTAARVPAPPGAVARLPTGILSDEFRDLFAFMVATGVRPGEARTLTADRIDLDAGIAVVDGKKGLRPVVLAEAAIEPLRRAIARHPTGPVFLNSRGEPWTAGGLSEQIRRARKRAGVEDVVAYHARGAFASRAHAAGADAATIAALLGHKDISRLAVLMRNYLNVDESLLRAAAEGAATIQSDHAEHQPPPGTTPGKRRRPKVGS